MLLDDVWGSFEGTGVIVYTGSLSVPDEHLCPTREVADMRIGKGASGDVWYCPALYSPRAKITDKGSYKTIENVVGLRCWWIDIDVKEKKGYATLGDAVEALDAFVATSGLPAPTVIQSGNGLHCYWIIDRVVEVEMWKPLANQLRDAAKAAGLLFDYGLTTNPACLLRVPGTFNCKDPKNKKPVLVAETRPLIPFESFTNILNGIRSEALAEATQALAKAEKAFEIDYDFSGIRHDANLIANACPAIAMMRDTKGNVDEPLWFRSLQLLKFAEDGARIAHEWSSGHPEYNQADTQNRLDRLDAQGVGPTLCTTFDSVCTVCKGCPHWGKISTPLVLGQISEPLVLSPEEFEAGIVITHPRGYVVDQGGTWRVDDSKPIRISRTPLNITQILRDEDSGDTVFELRYATPRRTEYAMIPAAALADKRVIAASLLNCGIDYNTLDPNKLIYYLNRAYLHISDNYDAEKIYNSFGWRDSSFVLGNKVVHNGKVSKARLSDRVPSQTTAKITKKGTLKEWSAAVSILAKNPRYIDYAYAFLAVIGSPIAALNNVSGGVLSLVGGSGIGKTTVANLAVSAYGHYSAFEASPQSTEKAFYEQFRLLRNLPTLINEAATIPHWLIEPLLYAAANGYPRAALNHTGKMRQGSGWNGLVCMTSNRSITHTAKGTIEEATIRRVTEIHLDQTISRDDAAVINEILRKSYGHAGERIIKYLTQHHAAITREFEKLWHSWSKVDIPAENRYGLWQIIAAMLAGYVLEETGIAKFDLEAIKTRAHDLLRGQATSTTEAQKDDVEQLLDLFIADNAGRFSMFNVLDRSFIATDFKGEIVGRYDYAGGIVAHISIGQAKLFEYAILRGIDRARIETYVKRIGGKVGHLVKVVPSLPNGIRCIHIPAQPQDKGN